MTKKDSVKTTETKLMKQVDQAAILSKKIEVDQDLKIAAEINKRKKEQK